MSLSTFHGNAWHLLRFCTFGSIRKVHWIVIFKGIPRIRAHLGMDYDQEMRSKEEVERIPDIVIHRGGGGELGTQVGMSLVSKVRFCEKFDFIENH